ncbi:type I toxin-antitoxin system Fst family toxin [Lactococcus insecticola]|nr:type I toxin-antitoxin system Fst family toxin [Lactococcus insecticola]
MIRDFCTLVVIPLLVGALVELFSYWLDNRDDD